MKINVAYACNESYMEQTIVSMTSLLENNKEVGELSIYFIDMGISNDSISKLNELIDNYGRELLIIDFEKLAGNLVIKETGRHIASVYAKLFFGRLKEIDKILYLDSDTIIVDSLSELWNIPLDMCYCAGVETIHSVSQNRLFGMTAYDRAINDGVVLINLKKWREDEMEEKSIAYINSFGGNPPVLSEGTINAVCKGKILILNPRYNLMSGLVESSSERIQILTGRKFYSQQELDIANDNPCIIHFLSGFYNRPWCRKCTHPLKEEYLKYRSITEWKDAPLSEKDISVYLKVVGLAYKYLPTRMFLFLSKIKNGLLRCSVGRGKQ